MKKRVLLLIILLFILRPVTIFSNDLGDFKESVEEEEEENQERESEDSDEYDDDDDDDGNPFLEFLWEITFFLWYAHNQSIYYAPYPYEPEALRNGDYFIRRIIRSDENWKIIDRNSKNYHFAFYGGANIDEDFNTMGGMTRLTGKFFNHLGPELEYRILWDGSDLLHILNTGVNLSFFQFDYLSLDFYVEGAFFFGLLERQGITVGAGIYTYPFKPISLEIRSGGMFFPSITFAEVEVKLGFHIGRGEIFADFYTLQSRSSALYSFGVGAGVHF